MKLAKLNGRAEIFHSIQGEGKSAGKPCWFVRTSLCNLQCHWCDTDYTWNWQGTKFTHKKDALPGYEKYEKADHIIELSVDEIAAEVMSNATRHIVLTGGEPLLQQDDLCTLMQTLRQSDETYFFEVETNGTLLPTEPFDEAISQYNVSPKLTHSGHTRSQCDRTEAMRFFADSPKAHFKFVIAAEADIEEVRHWQQTYDLAAERIYLMPQGSTAAELTLSAPAVVALCERHGYWFSDRLHVRLYGNQRGK